MSSASTGSRHDAFQIERHGEVTIIEAGLGLERMEPSLIEGASALLLDPLRDLELPLILVDLSKIDAFGSTFLALLIRCWKLVMDKGGMMALSGVSPRIRDLLRITSLDVVWPIYATRREALESLLAD
ncbi:MAG: STAS domain-containing protein [Isosphaeraceae bacterium]